jgi:hypothetical protein
LTTAQTALTTQETVFTTVKNTWDALLLAEKEKQRGDAQDRFNDRQREMEELQDKLARYTRDGNQAQIDQLMGELAAKTEEFNTASMDMDMINAEEAHKAEQEAFEEMMRQRGELEDTRAAELENSNFMIEDLTGQMTTLDEEIAFLLQLNSGDISQEDRDTNIAEISTFREEYFALKGRREEKETEMAAIATRHMKERADEQAADEKMYKE